MRGALHRPALSPREAALFVNAGGFDAALIDVGMVEAAPEGFLTDLINERVPFIYLTGYGGSEMPPLPEAETVLKPFHLPELMRRLHELLGTSSLLKEAAD